MEEIILISSGLLFLVQFQLSNTHLSCAQQVTNVLLEKECRI